MAAAKPKTAEKEKAVEAQPIASEAPAPQLPAAVEPSRTFEQEFSAREKDILPALPSHVSPARFRACALAAVKQNPELLECTVRSLFNAITRAAQDGLLPDGREGVITIYNTKVSKRHEPDRWAKMPQWNPMVHGLRKRARELDDILIDAQVVYQNDHFLWDQGDNPRIEHRPAQLGGADGRGEGIGAYAIFKREDGTILAREVMAKHEIEKVREQSKAKDSLMWTAFWSEGWRKSVIRRGIKTVPVSEEFDKLIQRNDEEHFDFTAEAPAIEGNASVMIPPRPVQSDFTREPEPPAQAKRAPAASKEPDGRPEPPPVGEVVSRRPEPPPAMPEPEQWVEPAEDEEEEGEPEQEEIAPEPSAAYRDATTWLATFPATIKESAHLDDAKKSGRSTIDSWPDLTDDERDMLRGEFTTMVLSEQKSRAGKRRR